MGQRSFFDIENRLRSISKLGDPRERLTAAIPWDKFRALLEPVHEQERKSNAGRKPFDVVLMLKILVLQTRYNRADEQVEYQLRDRVWFARFLGLGIADEVPDATTVWRFRERLKDLGLLETRFDRFEDFLAAAGFEAKHGQLMDACIVPVPIQRNPRAQNRRIKPGEVVAAWREAKRAQKDVAGRWTGERGKRYFGDKHHIRVDVEHKLIRRFVTTPANVHDSRVFDDLVDPDNVAPGVWADSAYRREETEEVLQDAGYKSQRCEKGQRNRPLTDEQQANNRTRSQVRSRVEHVFGFQENRLGGKFIRTIGLAPAKVKIGLMNLTDNLMRYLQLTKDREGISAVA